MQLTSCIFCCTLRNNWGMRKTNTQHQKVIERDPLVMLAEVLTQIDRREGIVNMEKIRREAEN